MRARFASAAAAAAVGILALFVASGRESVPFHGDEAIFVALSRDYQTGFVRRDASALVFDAKRRGSQEQWLRLLNGSLAPLAIGFTCHAAGLSPERLNGPWRWHVPGPDPVAQWRFNVAHGNRPDDALLAWARLPSTLATAASVALVYAVALALSGQRAAAVLAAAVFATTPSVLLNGRRAMQEGALLLCTALLGWVALRTLRAQGRSTAGQGTAGWWLALAAASGLALAAKHSAAVVVAAALLAGLCAPWLRRERTAPAPLYHVAAVAGVALFALAVFSLLVPVWWSLPRTFALAGLGVLAFGLRGGWRTRAAALVLVATAWLAQPTLPADTLKLGAELLAERRRVLAIQHAGFAGDDSPVRRLALLARESFVAKPQYFEDPAWAAFPEIQAQIAAYDGSVLAGRPGGLAWGIPLAALSAVGALAAWRRRREPEIVFLAAWLALPALALLANPLPWQRYYLPLQAPLAVLAGLGAASGSRVAFRRVS